MDDPTCEETSKKGDSPNNYTDYCNRPENVCHVKQFLGLKNQYCSLHIKKSAKVKISLKELAFNFKTFKTQCFFKRKGK